MIYEHIGITVGNLDRSVEFYTKVFNLKILKRTAINAYLYKNTDMIELIRVEKPEEAKKPKKNPDLKKLMTSRAGLIHIGFRVNDMDKAIARFDNLRKSLGGELVVPPVMFEQKLKTVADIFDDKLKRVLTPLKWRIAVISDPDDVLIELQER